MKTIEIPRIGTVPVKPSARNLFFLARLAAWPFLAIGGFGLAATAIPFLTSSHEESTEMLPRVLLGFALSGALLGIGALIRFGAGKLIGRRFFSADWFIVMANAVGANNGGLAREAAAALVERKPEGSPDFLMTAEAYKLLAEQDGQNWSKMLSMLDQAKQQGHESFELELDRALALQNLSRFDEAIAICDEFIPSESELTLDFYSIKAASLQGTGRLDEALVAWEAIESAATQTIGQIQQGRVPLGDGKSAAVERARLTRIQGEASQHKEELLKG